MNNITPYIPFLIPIIFVEMGLAIAALIHVIRHNTYRFGNRIFWIVVVLLVEFIGPILYFTVGRGDD